ncbi:MAG TPA: choice-of-anchor D domain-containing protein [Pseudonocardiaceae bacterium]|nr:choice-of-anchor D domain-containing protein [Pseudonocardiaceae bacterium]
MQVAHADVTTVSLDTLRTGWDSAEPNLLASSVVASDFGQQFKVAVNGQVYAQPIVANGTLIVGTDNDQVYGLDPGTGAQRWHVSEGAAWPAATVGCGDLTPTIGITSTPVYDPSTNAVYFTAKVNDGPNAAHPHWYLHALNVGTGAELAGFPTTIQGSPTNAPGVVFNPETQNQRPGLLLMNGVVYAAFGSTCDYTPYVGYVVGVNDSTGKQTAMWATETSGSNEGGIWQAGGGLVSDGAGRIILATGNGVSPAPGAGDTPPGNLGESVVRLGVGSDGSLSAQSFFSPYNNVKLNQDDADLGSGGPMAIPPAYAPAAHPHLVVQVGKDGRIYLLDADHLGGSAQGAGGTDAALSVAGPFQGVWGHPAFYGSGTGYVYVAGNTGPLRALALSGGSAPSLTSVATSTDNFGYTSGSPIVTSNGTGSGALVWVVWIPTGTAAATGANAQLRAYDAIPTNGVLNLRYSIPIGTAAKFTTVATDNGHIYLGTRDGNVYSIGQPNTAILNTTPYMFADTAVNGSTSATVTVQANVPLTITGATTASPFGATPAGLPVTLAQGASYSVPVTFNPSTWGNASGTLKFATSQGTVAVALSGRGTQPGLAASPAALSFGGVQTGSSTQLGVQIVNTGTVPETINTVTGPSQQSTPFSIPAGSTPVVGDTIAPGTSATIPVVFAPTSSTTCASCTDSVVVTGTDGTNPYTVTVPLSGTPINGQGVLTISPTTVNFGAVAIGKSVTQSFTVSNTGTAPLVINLAKAPAGVFTASNPLAEGQPLQPGDSITQSVTFTPNSAYPAQAFYQIGPDTGQGILLVTLEGNLYNGSVDPIADHLAAIGGTAKSGLGFVVSGEYATTGGGMAEDFSNGTIYWSAATGAWMVKGRIWLHYKALGGPASFLGYPTTDENTTPDGIGRYNHFAKDGSIYWTPNTDAWSIHGAIQDHWAALGWERSPVGYPITDESGTPDGNGRYNHFSLGGSIYWTRGTGAQAVYGAIRSLWASMGWERSYLGYPTSDEYGITGGRRNNFQHGLITYSFSTGRAVAS